MKFGYSWKMGPFKLLYDIKDHFTWLKKQSLSKNLILPEYIASNNYYVIDHKKFQFNRINLEECDNLLKNDSAQLFLYQNILVFGINTKINYLNEDVFNLLIEDTEIAESKNQSLYIIPLIDNFSAGADLKLITYYIKSNNLAKLEEFLTLGQKSMLRLKYSKYKYY